MSMRLISRLGPPRFDGKLEDATPGIVTTRKMTPAELAKYGPPTFTKKSLTLRQAQSAVKYGRSLQQEAWSLKVSAKLLLSELKRYGIAVPTDWRAEVLEEKREGLPVGESDKGKLENATIRIEAEALRELRRQASERNVSLSNHIMSLINECQRMCDRITVAFDNTEISL